MTRAALLARVSGVLPEGEWEAVRARTETATRPEPSRLVTVRTLASFGEAWDIATPAQRREAVRIVLDQVHLNLATKEVFMEPNAEYAPLFAHRREHVDGPSTPDRSRAYYTRRFTPRELLGVAA